jgi:hypothetical protein
MQRLTILVLLALVVKPALALPSITRGLLVKLRTMLLIAWPALGLAGFGAIVQAIGLPALSPTHYCLLDGSAGYVTQEAVASVPPDELADLKLEPVAGQAGGVTFIPTGGLVGLTMTPHVTEFYLWYTCAGSNETSMAAYFVAALVFIFGVYCLRTGSPILGWSLCDIALFIITATLYATHAVVTVVG